MTIINAQASDLSTNKVIRFLKKPFIRFNDDSPLQKINISFEKDFYETNVNSINIEEGNSYWYRRGNIGVVFPIQSKQPYFEVLNYNLSREWKTIKSYLDNVFQIKKSLGSGEAIFQNNKLSNLIIAQKVGLKIPSTLVTSQKEELEKFAKKHSEVITKSIGDLKFSFNNSPFRGTGTQAVNEENIKTMEPHFFPTLVQEKIQKEFEVRVFFFAGNFYSMAIFSQVDSQTSLDYRNYNEKKPNRNIPYKLPSDIQQKLISLMAQCQLDTGSIDLIVTPENQHVFLEVNPVGQFDWLSKNCNFYVEREIAKYLENED